MFYLKSSYITVVDDLILDYLPTLLLKFNSSSFMASIFLVFHCGVSFPKALPSFCISFRQNVFPPGGPRHQSGVSCHHDDGDSCLVHPDFFSVCRGLKLSWNRRRR